MTQVNARPETPSYEDLPIEAILPETSLLITVPVLQRWCSVTETLRRDHFDSKYSIEQDGLDEALISGSWSQAHIHQLLFNWVGPDGWVWKVSQKNAAHVFVGETLTFSAQVTDKYAKEGRGSVEVDHGLRKQDGSIPVPGQATLVLPLRGGRPVPYPFVPPVQ